MLSKAKLTHFTLLEIDVNGARIATLALGMRRPTYFEFAVPVRAGKLTSYGPDLAVLFRRAADYVDKIYAVPSRASYPSSSRPIDLVINLKTAKALGLSVPPMLLATADEVIE